jgi:DNA-binding MarR family transcriptional regulator
MLTAWGIKLDDKKKAKDIQPRRLYAVSKQNTLKGKYTHQQGQYLAFIYYYAKIHGVAPSEADMQRFFRVSPPSVHQMIVSLEERGFIKKIPGQARSISLLVPRETLPDLE